MKRVVGVFGLIEDRPDDSVTAPPPHLTPRQVEVLRRLEQGYSTKQIAAELHLSTETVRNHVRRLFRALGVNTRLEAVAAARAAFPKNSNQNDLAETDEAAAERKEGFVDLGSTVVADEEPLEVVQPGDGALDDPADAAEPGAMFGRAAGDQGLDAARSDEPSVLVVVVAAIGDELSGRKRGLPMTPRTGGTLSMSGISWVTSLRLPPVSVQASGIPLASTSR